MGPRRGLRILRSAPALALALGLAATAPAQDRVAQLSTVSGDVSITRAATGAVDAATQVGPRVRNGSVFAGDVIATAAEATAVVLFSDGTQVSMKASTSLTVREADVVQAAAGQPARSRSIRVLAGDILAEVVKNPAIATEFETPSGTAAVKGTSIAISVASGPAE